MARVVKLAVVRGDKPMSDEPEFDPIFFPKQAIVKGVILVNYGRRDPGSEWVVVKIETYMKKPSGLFDLVTVGDVVHLSDLIYLKRTPRSDDLLSNRRTSFSALSYSAIWRLKQ